MSHDNILHRGHKRLKMGKSHFYNNNALLWFSTELVLVKMSSNQTCKRLPTSPCSSQVNMCWKVQGALQSPCCIVLELYVLWGIENVIWVHVYLFIRVRHIDFGSIYCSGD